MPEFKVGDKVIVKYSDSTAIDLGVVLGWQTDISKYPATVYNYFVNIPYLDKNDIEYKILTTEDMLELCQEGVTYTPQFNDHNGHNVIDNTVLGKTFHYCRDCKVEV